MSVNKWRSIFNNLRLLQIEMIVDRKELTSFYEAMTEWKCYCFKNQTKLPKLPRRLFKQGCCFLKLLHAQVCLLYLSYIWVFSHIKVPYTRSFSCTTFTIGIKHDFLCINICWAPRDEGGVETRAWTPPEGPNRCYMYQKIMFDRYYCIKHFFRSKPLEKLVQKCFYLYL